MTGCAPPVPAPQAASTLSARGFGHVPGAGRGGDSRWGASPALMVGAPPLPRPGQGPSHPLCSGTWRAGHHLSLAAVLPDGARQEPRAAAQCQALAGKLVGTRRTQRLCGGGASSHAGQTRMRDRGPPGLGVRRTPGNGVGTHEGDACSPNWPWGMLPQTRGLGIQNRKRPRGFPGPTPGLPGRGRQGPWG